MKRRTFIRSCAAGALTLIGRRSPTAGAAVAAEEGMLETAFGRPPASARPKTWWHWMNGNITAEGITRDLEFMNRVGLGGFQIFQVGTGIPKGPIAYGGEEWVRLLQHAAKEADRLGLEFDMMNCPGWSSSGGPWITPELSMQQLTWSEALVAGGKKVSITLPQPYMKQDYCQDAIVLAFPSLAGETRPLRELLTSVASNHGPVDTNLLTDNDLSKGVALHPDGASQPAYLQLEFADPFEARSIAVYLFSIVTPGAIEEFFGAPSSVELQASDDGVEFRKVSDLNTTGNVSFLGGQMLEVPSTGSFPAGRAKYYRLVLSRAARVAGVRLSGATYVADWPHKANFAHRGDFFGGSQQPLRETGLVPKDSVIDPASVLDISRFMDSQGHLNWPAPAGDWTILRLGQTTTGAENHPAPDGGLGLECDKYSQEAYDFHFNHFFGKLLTALQPLAAKGQAGATIDSYEVGMQTWTAKFPEEFQSRRGYDLRKYLPAMTGRVVGSGDISDRFLWDIRRTDADLMDDFYYGRFAKQCRQHGIKAYAEPYSGGPFEEIQAGAQLDIPMGEFWVGAGNHYSVKLAGSIGHLFGKRVVAAESFTGAPQYAKWQEHPYAMKAQGDWMYTQGLNQFIFHVYAMQPHPSAVPGMTMGPWGWMHSRNNTWAEREGAWLEYVDRCQYMLQQGLLVADLVYFMGVDIPVDTPVLPDQLSPSPPDGYYYDVTNADAILTRMSAEDGRIALPDGVSYRALVLPPDKRLTLELLSKLRHLVNGGICLVGPKPEHTPGLTGFPASDQEAQRIADEIWGNLDGTTVTERTLGKGQVFWGQPLTTVLEELNVKPDCDVTSRSGDAPINFIHRRIGDREVYFVACRRRQSEELLCTFRVKGKQPEFWDPETGKITPAPFYDLWDGRVRVPVRLGPAGSVFVVFRFPASNRSLRAVAKNGETVIGTDPFRVPPAGRYSGVRSNFTISVWVMPDTDAALGDQGLGFFGTPTSFVFYPPAGEVVYGKGHAACGLVVGRNGVSIFERTKGGPSAVLVAPMPLAGWTHVAIVYTEDTPSLYVDGKPVRHGKSSGNVVHPGLGEAYQSDGAHYFHGNLREPELVAQALGEDRIQQLAAGGLPEPEEPPAVELAANGKPDLVFWQDGRYTLRASAGASSSVEISGIGRPEEVRGSWHVTFPPKLGAPPEITLPKLVSLHKHSDPGVKYFSGTATYTNRFTVAAGLKGGDKRLYLDLGWVQVIATVRLNGNDLGTLWKPPYRVDITDSVRSGENELEVLVSNLWVNRLIGDEQLPPENEYAKGPGFGAGAIASLPEWYLQGKPKPPGGRITFTTWKHFDKDSPLVESGLLGPVRLRRAVSRAITI